MDNILQTPDERNRYPNDPAVYVESKFIWYRVDVDISLDAASIDDGAAACDNDEDIAMFA